MNTDTSMDDAPRDYPVYSSLEEAERAAAQQQAVMRRSAAPQEPPAVDSYGTRARRAYQPPEEITLPRNGYNTPSPLARPQVRRVADDRPVETARPATPIQPAQMAEPASQPTPRRRRAEPQTRETPDWYQTAQAVQTPYEPERPAQPPQAPARRQPQPAYAPSAQSPYPPQSRQPAPQAGQAPQRPRPQPPRQPAPQADAYGQPFDRPYQVVQTQETEPDEKPARKPSRVPWAAIAVFVLAAMCVGLWIMGMNYETERETVLSQRETDERALLDRYTIQYMDLIDKEASAYNVNPAFIAAIVRTESHFDPKAESSMGARGLMQLMEDTASWVYDKIGDTNEYSFDLMYDADTNLRYGCWYINYLSEMFRGDPICVAAAYHTGHNWMRNILNNSAYSSDGITVALDKIPDESTRSYAQKVLTAYAIYRQKYGL